MYAGLKSSCSAAEKAMQIAADCCIYTNDTFTKKSLKAETVIVKDLVDLTEEEEVEEA